MISKGQIVIGAIGCLLGHCASSFLLHVPIELGVLFGVGVLALALIVVAIISPARRA